VAKNGREAVEKLSAKPCPFDAVLMDLRMPVMDGIEATKYCRDVLKLKDLPIIAVTAEVGGDIKEAAMKAGANDFFTKPVRSQELVGAIRSLQPAI
jgi:CheY-like chemotaxis protein